jgi:hypothetical protein
VIEWIRRLVRRGEPSQGQREAEGALDRARSAREEAEERRPIVAAMAEQIRQERAENRFATRIRMALEGEVP